MTVHPLPIREPSVIPLSDIRTDLDALTPCPDCPSEPAVFIDPADPHDWQGVLLHLQTCPTKGTGR